MKELQVRSATYDPNSELLDIELSDGSKFQYVHVPSIAYTGFLTSSYQLGYMDHFLSKNYEFFKQ